MRPLFVILFVLLADYSVAQIKIEGIVKDSTGRAISGANVLVLPDSSGTVTTSNGSFLLDFEEHGNYTLHVSHIQYQTKVITLSIDSSTNESIEITLEEKQEVLDELEVLGTEPAVIAVSRVRINTESVRLSPVPGGKVQCFVVTVRCHVGSTGNSRSSGRVGKLLCPVVPG